MSRGGISRRGLLSGAIGLASAACIGSMAGCGGSSSSSDSSVPSAAHLTGGHVRWRTALPGADHTDATTVYPLGTALKGDTLYVTQAGCVTALRASSGKKLWRSTNGPTEEGISGPQPRDFAPVVADGVVYFVNNNPGGSLDEDKPGVLYAVDARTGKQRWAYPGATGKLNQPVAGSGAVCVATSKTIHLVDAQSGHARWTLPLPAGIGSGTMGFAAGLVILVDDRGTTQALNAETRDVVWAQHKTDGRALNSSITVVGDVVYVGAHAALDLHSGESKWPMLDSMADAGGQPVTVSGQRLYVSGSNANGPEAAEVLCVDASIGYTHWRAKVSSTKRPRAFGPPAVLDGKVYVGSYDNGLFVFDAATGKQRARFDVGRTATSPPVADGHTVYVVVGGDGKENNEDSAGLSFADFVYALEV